MPAEADPGTVSLALRRFLKIEDQRLRMAHYMGAPGCVTAARRSFVLDTVVEHAFRHSTYVGQSNGIVSGAESGCALLAVGCYGRAELAPYSDIDLLLLYSGQRLGQVKPILSQLLWIVSEARPAGCPAVRVVSG